MNARAILRGLVIYAVGLALVCAVWMHHFALRPSPSPVVLASVWRQGKLESRTVVANVGDAAQAPEGAELVYETVVAESHMLTRPEALFAISLVPGRDGVVARLDGKTAYVTPDDLLSHQAYDHGIFINALTLSLGVDVPVVLALLSEQLHKSARDILDRGDIARIRVERARPAHPPAPRITGESVTDDLVRQAALDAAQYLARGVDAEGRFRYLVNATDNRSLPGYDWPRHAGATYFLAQAAALSGNADLRYATLRAAGQLRDRGLAQCGAYRCVAQDDIAEIGSSALAVVAFVEIVRQGIDGSYRPLIAELTRFLRSQQRPDGEFMHQYDRSKAHPIDVQFVYFTGEATLALSRAYGLEKKIEDLEAARRGLARLVGPAWYFFGNHYYFGEEHWTCQAMDDLAMNGAPDPAAFDFCLRWQRFGRRMQHTATDSPQDADGALGIDPVITPRLTPVASRCEAAVATLDAVKHFQANEEDEVHALDLQTRRALAFILRHQFRPGPSHLFADPAAVFGAIPGSPVDFQLRIDYVQHTGSAMIRWLEAHPRTP